MTAVLPRRVRSQPHAVAAAAQPHRGPGSDADLCTWVLSVRDWRVHALTVPSDEVAVAAAAPMATRCGAWHLVACPVGVARRDEVCPRCAAGGVQRLELLPSREEDGTAAR